MYFTSDSLLPENQQPLMITVAPFGSQWLLGLPPNRNDYQLGFMATDTDGKLRAATVGSDSHALAGQMSDERG